MYRTAITPCRTHWRSSGRKRTFSIWKEGFDSPRERHKSFDLPGQAFDLIRSTFVCAVGRYASASRVSVPVLLPEPRNRFDSLSGLTRVALRHVLRRVARVALNQPLKHDFIANAHL